MKNRIILLKIISILACASALADQGAATTLNLEGNLNIAGDPLTPDTAGSLRVGGSLTVSDNAEDRTFASGRNSIAVGNSARALGDASLAISGGEQGGATAYGANSFAFGLNTRAGSAENPNINYALAFGGSAWAYGDGSIAIGTWAYASHRGSKAVGSFARATNHESIAIGYCAEANGYMSMTYGHMSTAPSKEAAAIGYGNTASGIYSIALGHTNSAEATASSALGFQVKATGHGQTVVGIRNNPEEYGDASPTTWQDTDPVFVVGNGKDQSNLSNALIVRKNGNTSINGDLTANNIKVKRPSGGILMGVYGHQQ